MRRKAETLSRPDAERAALSWARLGSRLAGGLRLTGVACGARVVTVAACTLGCASILLFDVQTPLGVAAATPYCLVVLASIWARDPRVTVCFTVFTSLLVGLGWHLSVPGGEPWMVLANRVVAVGLVWACGGLIVSRLLASSRFRAAVAAAPAGMIVANRRGRIRLANPEAGRMFGRKSGDLLATTLTDLLADARVKTPTTTPRSMRDVLGERVARSCKAVCRRADGTAFPAEIELRPIRGEFGPMVLLVIRDLSDERRHQTVNARLAAIVRSSRDSILSTSLDGRVRDWNSGARDTYGYTRDEVRGRPLSVVVPSELHGELDAMLEDVRGGLDVFKQTTHLTKSRHRIDVDLRLSPIRNRSGRVTGVSIIARDTTRIRASERLLREVNTALSHAMPGMMRFDAEGKLEYANEAAGALLGASANEPVARTWQELVWSGHEAEFERAFEVMLREGSGYVTVRPPTPEECYLDLFLVRRLDLSSRFEGFHLFLRDVTQRALAEAQVHSLAGELAEANRRLDRQAHIDPLTGLVNRRGLQRHIMRLESAARDGVRWIAVLLVDVDDFKSINERFGHAGGDRVLIGVARRLEDAARICDPVARIGGDEFMLLLPQASIAQAARVAERMCTAVAEEPIEILGASVQVTCSIGVAAVPYAEVTLEGAIEAARFELSCSKNGGKNRICRSLHSGRDDSSAGGVLRGRGLRAFHQPIFDLVEKRVVAYELLSRGPEGAYERPEALLALVGPGDELDRLDLACLRVCAGAASRLPGDHSLHFNLFPSTLLNVGAERVLEELACVGEDRACCIELNEGDLPGDSDELSEQVAVLKRAGVQIAIDDVGFGRSSLESLLYLEPDVIKIDRCCAERDRHRVLERLLSVSNVLRARVIVEGIEDEAVLARVSELRVRYGQGFLWGRPAEIGDGPEEVLWPHRPPAEGGGGGRRGRQTGVDVPAPRLDRS